MKRIVIIVCLAALSLGAQAQMVGATNRQQGGGFSMGSNDPEYHPTGAVIHFEVGYPILAIGGGYQLNPNVMVGGGIALFGNSERYSGYYQHTEYNGYTHSYENRTHVGDVYAYNILPIYAEARFSTPGYRWSLFADVKLGFVLGMSADREWGEDIYYGVGNPLFMAFQVGAGFKNLSLGVGYGFAPGVVRLYNSDMQKENHSYGCFYTSLSYNLPFSAVRRVFKF